MAGPSLVNGAPWRVAAASVVGTAHERAGRECQDASAHAVLRDLDGDAVLAAVVADGAGSAVQGLAGAALLCQHAVLEVAGLLAAGLRVRDIRRSDMVALVASFQQEADDVAAARGLRRRDYACTLVLAVLGAEAAVFAQIGDGGIVVGDDSGGYAWVFWPEDGAPDGQASFRGEYANQTRFATDADAGATLAFEHGRGVDEVALFSDGLQRLTLDLAGLGAHEPFFAPLFGRMREQDPFTAPEASAALGRFLQSPRVNVRTDDDKSLILATRRPPLAATR